MENLLTALKNADRICRQASVHLDAAAQIDTQREALAAGAKKLKTKWLLIGFGLWYVCNMAGAIFMNIPKIGSLLVALTSFGGIAAAMRVGVGGYKKAKADLGAQLNALARQAADERAAAQDIFDANYAALSFLPDDYWYPMATTYLFRAISSGRVVSLGEALDRFDAQLHRMRVEEANNQIVAQQQAQSAHLKSISRSSKVSAAANVTNTLFNIASRL